MNPSDIELRIRAALSAVVYAREAADPDTEFLGTVLENIEFELLAALELVLADPRIREVPRAA